MPPVLPLLVTVILWHAYGDVERTALERSLERIAPALAADGIHVEPLAIAFDAFHQKLETTIPRGHGPDLFIAAHDRLGDWRRRGLLRPLAVRDEDRAAYLPRLVEALSTEEGASFALPFTYKGLVLYRNLRLCPEPLEDADGLSALQARLPAGAFALAYDTGSLYFHAPFLLGEGGALFRDGAARDPGPLGVYAVLDPPARRSYERVAGLRRAGAIPLDGSSTLAEQLFNRGQAALVLSGPWFRGQVKLEADLWTVSPLFAVSGRKTGSFVSVEGLFLASCSRDAAAAETVARRLAAAWKERTALALQPPVFAGVYGDDMPPLIAAQREALAHGMVTPSRPEMAYLWEPVGGILKDMVNRDAPVETAVLRATQRLRLLARPRPQPAEPLPYVLLGSLACLLGAGWLAREILDPTTRARMARARLAYALSAPALVAMAALVAAPFLAGALLSVFSHHEGTYTFVGLRNFADILFAREIPLADPLSFYFTLAVTILWTLVNVALHAGIGLFLALQLRRPWLALRGVYRVLLILPWAVPSYITALTWRGLFDFQLGAINGMLVALGLDPVAWFQGFVPAFAANVITNTWLGFPFMMVVALGALQTIPGELEEVAALEGASAWQTLRHVTWPLVRPALFPAMLLGSVWTFNMFNVIYLVSGGEPAGATDILISDAYKWAFQRNHRYGYAAAYAVLIFGILLVYGRVLMREKREEGAP